ncbi:MAG TPA: hypothetical protein PKA33_01800 [Amaricoccus sp.]|uniref:hypothetical protein n=1 Tax=Amaricoccus sp. TaxID=1872485 RepID=UPI002C7CA3B7|nr:hypothetical protein [Amaricoccus sp.]HMR51171.1 hypothetical protein [Amaricoccus sp.]HMT98081.1 hypothetical protein [Amaricoccus sp.]
MPIDYVGAVTDQAADVAFDAASGELTVWINGRPLVRLGLPQARRRQLAAALLERPICSEG